MNLDPLEENKDTQIWKALEHAHLKEFIDITEILLKVALNTIILTPYLKRTIIMFGTTLFQHSL
jgi:hypothetical protein